MRLRHTWTNEKQLSARPPRMFFDSSLGPSNQRNHFTLLHRVGESLRVGAFGQKHGSAEPAEHR